MSPDGIESFIGPESGEGMSEAAFEAFREKMKASGAQMQAIKKEEGKQKKQEEKLIKILENFVKKNKNPTLITFVVKALEENIPALFILAVILLGNEDIQVSIGYFLYDENRDANREMNSDSTLSIFSEDQTLPLKAKIQMDNWVREMINVANENPTKFLNHVFDDTEDIKKALINLVAYVSQEFIFENKFGKEENTHKPTELKTLDFATFLCKGIVKSAQERLESIKKIEEKETDK